MESSSNSLFVVAADYRENELIEKLGKTPHELYDVFAAIIKKINIVVKSFNKINAGPINALYNHKINDSLLVDVQYYKTVERIHCISCKIIQNTTALYTFKNPQNQLQLTLTDFQIHRLLHHDFASLKQEPLHIHRILGFGYYSGET